MIDPESGLVEYPDRWFQRIARAVATILASLLPAISIIVLYFIKSIAARLGTMAAFTAVFSMSVSAFTSASPAEVFATTAAYLHISKYVEGICG